MELGHPPKNNPQTLRRVNYTILIVALMGISVGLVALIIIMTDAYGEADEKTRELLYNLAWTATATLAVTLLLLVWMVMRWLRFRLQSIADENQRQKEKQRQRQKKSETSQLSAWDLAGSRIAVPDMDEFLEDADEFLEDSDDDSDDDDGDDRES